MMSYITDTAISVRHFRGQTVPGDNTVPTASNTELKSQTVGIISGFLGTTDEPAAGTTELASMKEVALQVYGALRTGKFEELTKHQRIILRQAVGQKHFVLDLED